MNKFWNFLKYNNAIPLTLGVLFLSTGAAFAASPEARDAAAAAVLSQEHSVVSVDNTYIVNKDLSAYEPQVQIVGVTEDDTTYYVEYAFSTIDVVDYVWRDVSKSVQLRVDKSVLGARGDLGLYVTEQLKQNLWHEGERLKEVQASERRNVSQKVIATTYGGLIGKFLDDSTETLPGYTPVYESAQSREGAFSEPGPQSAQVSTPQAGNTTNTPPSNPSNTAPITLQLIGNAKVKVSLGVSYTDLGAFLYDPQGVTSGVHTYIEGEEVSAVSINTSIPAVYIIEYRVTNPQGGISVVSREVVVEDTNSPADSAPTETPPVDTPPTETPPAETPPSDAPPAEAPAPESTPPPASETPQVEVE